MAIYLRRLGQCANGTEYLETVTFGGIFTNVFEYEEINEFLFIAVKRRCQI